MRNPHISHLYTLRKDEPRNIVRDRTPFFRPVEIESDPDISGESTELLDWLIVIGGCAVLALLVCAALWLSGWRMAWL